ncbi:MAG: DUF2855 family protein [Pseudomonadales bacterium]|nr:DUF2855 family protein [Pseudomonadales bacterium]
MTLQCLTFQSERAHDAALHLANTRFVRSTLPDPAPGQINVRVDAFALTANNITYGVAGDSIGYWKFFPAPEPWGCIPVWGFGEVVQSNCPDVGVGQRFYGYYPMASHTVLQPVRVSAHGFMDGAAHRSELPPVYNQYLNVATDPGYDRHREAEQMLYRPLFMTSFFLDDFLAEQDFFGAANVILTSASSKTSIGLAHLLHSNRREQCRVLGLTSAGNRAFVESLGCYDSVCTYDEVAQLPGERSVLVDMAGSGSIRRAVHTHLGDALAYSCAVGATHWESATIGAGGEVLPGPKPTMFFAPSQIQKRNQEWGRETVAARIAEALQGFLPAAADWIRVQRLEGRAALEATYQAFLAGEADPASGYVLQLRADD